MTSSLASRTVVLIGLRPGDLNILDTRGLDLHAVVSSRAERALTDRLRQRMASLLVLDLPGRRMDEYDEHAPAIAAWVGRLAGAVRVVSLYEHTQRVAARIREMTGIPGLLPDVARRCRDKVEMTEAVSAAGVATVPTLPVDAGTAVTDASSWLHKEGANRVILKPRAGAASGGVMQFASPREFERFFIDHRLPPDYEVQPFIEDPVCHIDGLVRNDKLRFLSVSRYVGTTLRYQRDRKPMGSVTLDRHAHEEARVFTTAVLDALDIRDSVFHLEAFGGSEGFRFLEIGARFGGINIQPHLRRVYGIDLVTEALRAQALLPSVVNGPTLACDRIAPGSSGWLIVPRPSPAASRVRAVHLPHLPPAVIEVVRPQVGDELRAQGAELDAVVRMVLSVPGGNDAEVEALITSFADAVAVNLETRQETVS